MPLVHIGRFFLSTRHVVFAIRDGVYSYFSSMRTGFPFSNKPLI